MLFRSAAILAATTAVASGKSVEIPMNDVSVGSKLGGNIMSKARRLQDNNYNNYQQQNYQQNQDNAEAGNWISKYSIVFQRCAISDEYFAFEGGEQQDRNNWQGQQKQKLVHFKLCPTNGSSSCSGADYVVPMNDFVEMYIQSEMDARDYNCELTKNNCYCENANDDQACENQCYYQKGYDYCIENENQNQNGVWQFELEQVGRCEKMDLDVDEETLQYYLQSNGASTYNAYGGQQAEVGLFIGPTCSSNGKSIFLELFTDEWCSLKAPKGTFAKFAYGQELPYSKSSLIDSNPISCKEPQDANEQNQGDYQDEDDVVEVCERLYEEAAKCEKNVPSYYPYTSGCTLVKSLKAPGKSGKGSAAKIWASIFGILAVAGAGAAYYYHEKSKRSNVALVEDSGEGTMA